MNNYQKGRQYEYRTINKLREAGYTATRSAGSHGIYDVIAWNEHEVKFIQVKFNCYPTKSEIELFLGDKIPNNTTKEVWIYLKGKQPIILNQLEVSNGCKSIK